MTQTYPQPTQGVTPHLTVHGAADAAVFYGKAFGAEELARVPANDGKRLMHCHLRDSFGHTWSIGSPARK